MTQDNPASHEPIRTLYAREHATVIQGLGVFLAGPTPPDGHMLGGWRRILIDKLINDPRLDPRMIVVAPEPRSGRWSDIDVTTGQPLYDDVVNKQVSWERQYLMACDITVFWMPTYWSEARSGPFPANIGPTTRWEFGFYLQESLKNPHSRTFIAGAPDDADKMKWARRKVMAYKLPWHRLSADDKQQLVPESLVQAIAQTLLGNIPEEF